MEITTATLFQRNDLRVSSCNAKQRPQWVSAFRIDGGFIVSGIGILVVDESEYWRKFVSFALRVDGNFEIVAEASDGVRAIELAQRMQPTVVLMDIELPRLDGLEAARQILGVLPKTRVLF
jgi:PleD family two-component response regulator